jgi:lipid-binding SYLF domain-containing protein
MNIWLSLKVEQIVALSLSMYLIGAFVGVSLEGNVVTTRMDTNLRFYGDPYLTTADILLGTVDRPKAAEPLYTALEDLYSSLRN